MAKQFESWCERNEHKLFEHFVGFNEWLDSGNEQQAQTIREENGINDLS